MNRRKAIQNTSLVLGAAVGTPALLVLLNACKTKPRVDWKPQFFTKEEASFISDLVDKILPRTDTPGALDVKVDVFLDKVFAEVYDKKGQDSIRTDMAKFNADCQKSHGAVFAKLSEADKISVLKAAEKSSGKFGRGVWGKAVTDEGPVGFYRSIKSSAIWAYFTSEKMGRDVLNYDPVPGEYNGCLPVSDVGNRYSL